MTLSVTVQRLFAPTVLTTSAAVLFTSPTTVKTGTLANILTQCRIRCANTSGGAAKVTLYAVPSAGAPAAGNCFANQESIAANTHADYDVPLLGTGDTLQALADTPTAITVTALSGNVVTQ